MFSSDYTKLVKW